MEKNEVLSGAAALATGKRIVGEALGKRWKLYILSVFCMIGAAGFTGALAYSTRLIVNDIFVDDNAQAAVRVALLVIFVSVFKSGFQYANSVIAVLFTRSISADYQKFVFSQVLKQDVAYFAGDHPGKMMSQIRIFGNASGKSVVGVCNKLVVDIMTLIALFTVMLLQDPIMTLFCSVMVPLIFWLVSRLSRKVREVAAAETELTGAFFQLGSEALEGIKTVKSFQLEKKSVSRFDEAVEKLQNRLFSIAKITAATVPIMELLGGIVIGLFVIYAAWQTVTNGKTPGEFTAFITAFLMAYQPAERVSKTWVDLQKTLVQVTRMYRVLDAVPKDRKFGEETLEASEPNIRFEDVSFAYRKNQPALTEVNFEIKPAERVAIVGRSGAGKSTLIDLMQRFYDPTDGKIAIGDIDVRELSNEALRNEVALISQEVFLFEGTLRENIRDGFPDATDDEIAEAAEKAQLGDLLEQLPKGLDSNIGSNGRLLSGGQRQRLGIARAIVKKAKIYIFDEATSALDSHNERLIMGAIVDALKDATIVFVTHRASTLEFVDRILVLEGGQVVAFGEHGALLEQNPHFRQLFQSSAETPEDPETRDEDQGDNDDPVATTR